MTTIGFIGSGHIGGTVARLAVGVGHNVVLSNSRGPESLQELVSELGPRARAASRAEAAAAGEIVMVSTPIKGYPTLSDAAVSGKVVLDTGNYYPDRDGDIPELATKSVTDSGYLVRFLPSAEVVKVFNNIFYKHLWSLAALTVLPTARLCRLLETALRRRQRSPTSWTRSDTGSSTQARSLTVGGNSRAHQCMELRMARSTTSTVRLPTKP